MKKNNFILLIVGACTFLSCALDTFSVEERHDVLSLKRQEQQVIKITSFGTKPSIIDNSKLGKGKSIYTKGANDEFTDEKEFESSESIVLPELARYVYSGSLLMGNSIQNLDYKPISANLNPIDESPIVVQNSGMNTNFVIKGLTNEVVYRFRPIGTFYPWSVTAKDSYEYNIQPSDNNSYVVIN